MNVTDINVKLLAPKMLQLRDFASKNKLDIFGVTETWLNYNILHDSVHINGYNIVPKDREIGRGGEVLISIRILNIRKFWILMSWNRSVLFHKIISKRCPDYLYDIVKFSGDIYNWDLRHKYMIFLFKSICDINKRLAYSGLYWFSNNNVGCWRISHFLQNVSHVLFFSTS